MQSSKCAAFWNHTNIRGDNRIFPCCRFKTPIMDFQGSVSEILFHKSYQDLRMQSSSNQHIPGCEKCYHEESIGKKSLRQEFNENYTTDEVALKYLEIGFDNICNLTCDGCWEDFSSAWAKEKKLDKHLIIKKTKEVKDVPETISKVLFLGGEPLMTMRHYKFLQSVTNKSQVEIIYNTNGTFLLSEEVISILKLFQSVKFILSIDGYGQLNETVRRGSQWSDIISFIEQIKNLRFNLEVNTVLHVNNWRGLIELESFIAEQQLPWFVNILTYPAHLDIRNIEQKTELLDLLKTIKYKDLTFVANHVERS